MENIYLMGLALGATAESTGLAVAEGVGVSDRNPGPPRHINIKNLHSFPPGTEYMQMISHIRDLRKRVNITCLVVDQTVVGEPVVKMFRDELSLMTCPVIVGTQHREHSSSGADCVPKQTLVGEITVALEKARLKVAMDLALADELTQELVNYRNRRTSPSSSKADVWREHPSDHLVFAVGLACWKLQRLPFFLYDPT